MRQQKVLLIRNAAATDFGGAERLPVFIAMGLQALGYEPVIVSRSKKMLAFAHEHSVPTVKGWWWSQQNWSGTKALLTPIYLAWQLLLFVRYLVMFLHQQPAVVHLQSKDDFIAGTIAGRLCGARVVWSDYADLKHVWLNVTKWNKNPTGRLVYWCARWAHAITVVSNSEKKLVAANLPQHSAITKKIHAVHIGVANRDVAPHKKPDEAFVYCAASRLVTDKGIGELIAAFEKIHTQHPDTALWILGDGPERNKFDQDHKGVTFFGHVSDPLPMIKAADVFILPSHHEGFSVALVEVAMLGVPTIATSVGGNVEIIKDRQTGLLVRVKDSEDLANAMQLLLDDADLRVRLGKNARAQYEQHFQFSTMIEEGLLPLYGTRA